MKNSFQFSNAFNNVIYYCILLQTVLSGTGEEKDNLVENSNKNKMGEKKPRTKKDKKKDMDDLKKELELVGWIEISTVNLDPDFQKYRPNKEVRFVIKNLYVFVSRKSIESHWKNSSNVTRRILLR